ncbi:MAG: transposase [Kiritimatiellae bacterium]|nr:transposase [Kiritimatiellia bacterium]
MRTPGRRPPQLALPRLLARRPVPQPLPARRAQAARPGHAGPARRNRRLERRLRAACRHRLDRLRQEALRRASRQALEYLGRYTHKVAISDYRILQLEDGRVTFRYRDRADGDTEKDDDPVRRRLHRALPAPHPPARLPERSGSTAGWPATSALRTSGISGRP